MIHYIGGLKEPSGASWIKPWPKPGENKLAEHEGLPVSGYKPQSGKNVDTVNYNKDAEERTLRILDKLKDDKTVDQRWLAIGRTHIEQGWMAVNRAVFQPTRVKLTEDGA
jgi:hypothetical protein